MSTSIATGLNLAGLACDFVGAAFLAYDVLYGPGARFQHGMAQFRLEAAEESVQRHERKTRELPTPPYSSEEKDRILEKELPPIHAIVHSARAKVDFWSGHEHRAQRKALIGLGLLMFGFLLQGVGSALGATAAVSPGVADVSDGASVNTSQKGAPAGIYDP